MMKGLSELKQQIVDLAPDGIIFASADGTIRLWNSAAERIFGFTAQEAIGKTLNVIIPERFRERHWDGYREVMVSGATRYGSELLAVPAIRKDGERISIEFSIALLRDDAGRVAGAAAVIRDVTKRREEEQNLRRQLAELQNQG